jgi:hypothetical protein
VRIAGLWTSDSCIHFLYSRGVRFESRLSSLTQKSGMCGDALDTDEYKLQIKPLMQKKATSRSYVHRAKMSGIRATHRMLQVPPHSLFKNVLKFLLLRDDLQAGLFPRICQPRTFLSSCSPLLESYSSGKDKQGDFVPVHHAMKTYGGVEV